MNNDKKYNDKLIDELIEQALREDLALPEGLSERLEKRIDEMALQETGEKKARKIVMFAQRYWLYAATTAAALISALFMVFNEPAKTPQLTDTYDNPHEAALAAQHALALISSNLNKGLQKAGEAQKEFRNAQQIIQEQLDNK